MVKIRDSEQASILGDEQLRSLGFVLHARGRWLRNHAPSSRRCGDGNPLSPRRAGVAKRPRYCHVSAGPSVRSRGPSASGSRACPSQWVPLHRGGLGRRRQITSSSDYFSPPGHTPPRSKSGSLIGPSLPYRQCQTPRPSTSGDALAVAVYFPPLSPPVRAADLAAAPTRRALHRRHVAPIPADVVVTHGVGGWPPSRQTPPISLSPVVGPRPLPEASSSPRPSPAPSLLTPMPELEHLVHLPAEIRLMIVNELGPADMLALRRALPAAFGFIYGEDARYQRLYILEKLVARRAESSLWWVRGAGAASPESLAAEQRRLEKLRRAVRPRREPLLRYAFEKGYPANDIHALAHAYQEHNINPQRDLGIKGIRAGRWERPRRVPAPSRPRSLAAPGPFPVPLPRVAI